MSKQKDEGNRPIEMDLVCLRFEDVAQIRLPWVVLLVCLFVCLFVTAVSLRESVTTEK
jgi:hypothetical protein